MFLPSFLQTEPNLVSQGLAAAHIPSYADRDDVLEQVSPYLAPKISSTPGGWTQRRLAALSLMFLVSDTQTWDNAAEQLGLPPLAQYGHPGSWALVTDWLAFREGLIMLGNRLVQRGLVNYRARRVALSGLTEMPAADWAARPSMTSKPEVYDRGRICAAAWIWSELTGGRYDESPAWAAHPEFVARVPKPSQFYLRWESNQGPVRRNWLRSWGASYLEKQNCPGTLR